MNMNNMLAVLNTLLYANSGKQEMFKKLIDQSPADFWSAMKSHGLIEDHFNDLTAALNYMKQTYLNDSETSPAAAATLSRVTAAFDLEKSFSEKANQQLLKAQLSSLFMNFRSIRRMQRRTSILCALPDFPISARLQLDISRQFRSLSLATDSLECCTMYN